MNKRLLLKPLFREDTRRINPRRQSIFIRAFTLVEMLVVIGLMVLLMALIGPVIASLAQSKGFTSAAYDIQGIFDQARSYAMGNNTYVYVGLLQVPSGSDVGNGLDASGNSTRLSENAKAVGTLIAGVIASKDGTAGFDYSDVQATWKKRYNANSGKGFTTLGKLQRWENTQLVSLPLPPVNSVSGMYRPDPAVSNFKAMILGDSSAATAYTPFSLPLGKAIGDGVVNFRRVVMFDPQGIARIVSPNEVDAVSYVMEVGLMPTHGTVLLPLPTSATVSVTNCVALQFNAMTGSSKIYRP